MARRRNTIRKEARAAQFAEHRAQGHNQTDAWRLVTPNHKELPLESQYKMAWEFANDPLVKMKVAEVLQNASVAAQMNAARYLTDTQDLRDLAVAAGNYNAAMAGQRLIGQAAAVLKDSGTLTVEHRVEAEKHRETLRAAGLSEQAIAELMPATSFGSKDETKH